MFATLWTLAHQAPQSMGVSRQEYWSGLPCLFSRRSFQSRDQTNVSCISCTAGRFLKTEAFGKTGCRLGFSSVTQSCPTLCSPMNCSTPGLSVHHELPSLPKLMSTESVMPSNHLILIPFSSCLQSCPASGFSPVSQFFASGGQSIGVSASASVLPMNIQD